MRILMVVRPATGGMKGQALALARGMAELGHEVEIAAPTEGDVLAEAERDGLSAHAVPIVGPLSPRADARAVAALARLLRRSRYDVVHAHGFKAGLVTRIASMFAPARAVVVTVHNHVLYRDDISALTKWRYKAVERLLSVRSARYIAVSDSLRDELVSAYHIRPERVVTVHNGVDVRRFLGEHDRAAARQALDVGDEVPVLGTACRFAPQKGLRDLIDALPAVLKRVPNARLVLAGDGPMANELKQRARDDGVADAIVWPGMIDDIPTFLSGIDTYVSSSLSEGLPLSLVEAAAAAVPTVATKAGGTPEVIADGVTGLLVEPGDPEGLADACVRMLEDRETAHMLAEAARRRALEEFTPESMIVRTLEVYREALPPLAWV